MVEGLPDDVHAAVQRAIGPIRATEERSWPHGVTRVWWVLGGSQRPFWVKQHTQARKFLQESRAYDEVVPILRAGGHRVPDRLGEDRELRLLVLSDVAGRPVPEDDLAVHRQAGATTAAIHALPLRDVDPLTPFEVLHARLAQWSEEARGVVDDAIVARVAEEIADPAPFEGCPRTWCHRDWSPRNWLVDAQGWFGLIDFEHCGPDLWLVDLLKLADDVWRRVPATRDAFFDGYGRTLGPEDLDRLRRLMWLSALRSTTWARAYRDPAYERHGRALFAALEDGWVPGSPE